MRSDCFIEVTTNQGKVTGRPGATVGPATPTASTASSSTAATTTTTTVVPSSSSTTQSTNQRCERRKEQKANDSDDVSNECSKSPWPTVCLFSSLLYSSSLPPSSYSLQKKNQPTTTTKKHDMIWKQQKKKRERNHFQLSDACCFVRWVRQTLLLFLVLEMSDFRCSLYRWHHRLQRWASRRVSRRDPPRRAAATPMQPTGPVFLLSFSLSLSLFLSFLPYFSRLKTKFFFVWGRASYHLHTFAAISVLCVWLI